MPLKFHFKNKENIFSGNDKLQKKLKSLNVEIIKEEVYDIRSNSMAHGFF